MLGCAARPPEDPVERAARGIEAEAIQRHGRRLTDEALAGRHYASPGADSAAAYIVAQLRARRIPPVERAANLLASHPASFVHHFSVTLYRLSSQVRLVAQRRGSERPAQLGFDFMPLVFSRDGRVEGRVTWLQYGQEPVAGDIADRVVVVAPGVAAPPAGASVEVGLYRTTRRLEDLGAIAVLFAGDTDLLYAPATTYPSLLTPELAAFVQSDEARRRNVHTDRLGLATQAQVWQTAERRTIPACVVRNTWAGRLQGGDTIALDLGLRPEVSLAQNLLVGFRGRTRPDEIVALAARYDHAGTNADGDILNGAEDATAAASLLEIGAAFAAVAPALERSVLLLFLAAEGAGPQGSEALLADLPQLLGSEARLVALYALGGLGRRGMRPLLVVGGSDHPDLFEGLAAANRRALVGSPMQLQRLTDVPAAPSAFVRTPMRGGGHWSFVRRGIPAVLVDDGSDPAWRGTPGDDWKNIDVEQVTQAARLVFTGAHALATDLRPTAVPASAGRP